LKRPLVDMILINYFRTGALKIKNHANPRKPPQSIPDADNGKLWFAVVLCLLVFVTFTTKSQLTSMHHEEIEPYFDASCQQIIGLDSEILWEAHSSKPTF
jgi:hypothetical protein